MFKSKLINIIWMLILISCSTKYDISSKEVQYISYGVLPVEIKNTFLRSDNILGVDAFDKKGSYIEGSFINLDSTQIKIGYEYTGHVGMWPGEIQISINDTIYYSKDGNLDRFCIYKSGSLYYLVKDLENYPSYNISNEELETMKVAIVKLR